MAGRKSMIQRPREHVQDCFAQHCNGLEEPHPFPPHLSPSLLGSLDTTESVSNNDTESDRANEQQMAMAINMPTVCATCASMGLETGMQRTTKERLGSQGIRRSGNEIHSESECPHARDCHRACYSLATSPRRARHGLDLYRSPTQLS